MEKIFIFPLIALGAFLFLSSPASAAVMDSPSQVLLSPAGARLSVEAILPLNKGDGRESINILLPLEAKDMVFDVPGYTVIDWRIENHRIDEDAASGSVSGRRAALLKEKDDVDSDIRALEARLSLWSLPAANPLPSDEMTRRDAKLEEIVPQIEKRRLQLKKRSGELKRDIEALPNTAEMGKKVTVNIQPKAGSAEDTAVVRCSYTLDNCGWRPLYRFDAHPDADNVGVSLVAEIWQYSGIDWQKSHITLVSQGGGQVAPGRLHPWSVRMHEPEEHMAVMMSAPAARNMDHMEGAAKPLTAKRYMPQTQSEATAFSYWDLGAKNVIEGSTRLSLKEELWNAPLTWLGRPSVSNVAWLKVRHVLDNKNYWPAGQAVFSIDGHAVGSGAFALKDGAADLFFGPDSRVSLSMERKSRLGDKKGIIDRRKTMDWTWEILITNSRGKDVNIRVEDPAPEPDDKAININYVGSPAPREDKEHVLFWDVTVPAGEKFSINHGVSLSAPAEADIRSGR